MLNVSLKRSVSFFHIWRKKTVITARHRISTSTQSKLYQNCISSNLELSWRLYLCAVILYKGPLLFFGVNINDIIQQRYYYRLKFVMVSLSK